MQATKEGEGGGATECTAKYANVENTGVTMYIRDICAVHSAAVKPCTWSAGGDPAGIRIHGILLGPHHSQSTENTNYGSTV